MNKKLTLLLDEKIISRAKVQANKNHESLSGMVARYFTYLARTESITEEGAKFPTDIEQLIGIADVPNILDVKNDYRKGRIEKGLHD